MARARIVLATLPRLLRDIIAGSIEARSDVELAGETTDLATLPALICRVRPDAIVLGCEEVELDRIREELFRPTCGPKLLAITAEGRQTFLVECRPCTSPLGEVSSDELLDAIATRGSV